MIPLSISLNDDITLYLLHIESKEHIDSDAVFVLLDDWIRSSRIIYR
jgi:hypothetical protein